MSQKWIDRITAGAVFAWALVLYVLTVAPTAAFWDAGEFIASVYKLQVMHPPGAPFYMLVGRFFSMFAPSEESVALAVNMISVLASAGAVLFAHLVIVRLVRLWQPDPEDRDTGHTVVALGSGVIGALTFAATDSFWFNAVEAEVYALSMFFTAAVIWLIMVWSEEARIEEAKLKGGRHLFGLEANRYLVLIAYLFGLALGVHLLNLLAFFFIALIIFFTEFDKESWSTKKRWQGLVATGVVSSLIFFAIYPGVVLWIPEIFEATGAPFVTSLLIAGVVIYAIYATHKRSMKAANLAALCTAVVLIGFSTYSLIFIRSATEPNIDLNDPDTVESFISYLQREQYGSTPLLRGVTFNDETGEVPRAQDASQTWFPRRHSIDPKHWRVYDRYDSDLGFFLDYQIEHMYVRYFMWNFVGRANDEQGAPSMTGISMIDPESVQDPVFQTPSEKSSRNVYFALPLLLGLFGAFYHFSRDWRRAFSVFILFFVTGIGIIIYLNQTPMQPRERDYSYVASFFAFSLWVGIGAGGIIQMVYESIRDSMKGLAQAVPLAATGLVVLLAVPGWMTYQNYDDHDRSGRYVARDYAYNMLNSVAEDGIIFTNGDNDTYPLWYLQEVEGVRTDVRVVNLSLLNTPWYINQLRTESAYGSDPVPMTYSSDQQVEDLRPTLFQPQQVRLPVDTTALKQTSEVYLPGNASDSLKIESPMTWKLSGRQYSQDQNMLQVADLVAYNILRANAENGWERPIYFAVTVAQNSQLDLQNYFQMEGQAYRVVPIRHNKTFGRVVPELTAERMENFRFTNLADPDVYFDSNSRNMVDDYRLNFSQAAEQLAGMGQQQRADAMMSRLVDEVPFTTIPADMQTYLLTARALESAGNFKQAASVMKKARPLVLHELRVAQGRKNFSYALQYAGLVRSYLTDADQQTIDTFDRKIDQILADAPFPVPNEVRRRFGLAASGDSASPRLPNQLQQQTAPSSPAPSEDQSRPQQQPSAPSGSGDPSSN
jgi:hypothetical protein